MERVLFRRSQILLQRMPVLFCFLNAINRPFIDRNQRIEMGYARRALVGNGKSRERGRGRVTDCRGVRHSFPHLTLLLSINSQATITAPPSADASAAATPQNGNELAVGAHTGGLPLAANSVLPARPNLPDDPVIPHNGFATVEEGEKAFTHLLRKAGIAPDWTWEKTMRAIITDPLYKALNSLSEKKAVFEKVSFLLLLSS